MSRDFCRGCGAPLQSENSDKAGYIPGTVLGQRGQLICQRCYKMTHYGQAGAIIPSGKAIDRALQGDSSQRAIGGSRGFYRFNRYFALMG